MSGSLRDGKSFILMNAPRRPDGPPVRDGKPYSAIAHLAEDVTPFIAVDKALRARGLSAPEIFAADRDAGLLVLEDLGHEAVVAGEPPAPIEERYQAAVDLLAELHRASLPHVLPVVPGVEYRLPRYDLGAFLIEVELLIDWYLPRFNARIGEAERQTFLALWHDALQPALNAPPTWVLRDYHSPNLMWLPQRDGIKRVGLLDFQDAQWGPAAYDVASLLQDARVDVPERIEIALLSRYARARRDADASFDAGHFAQLYATLAAQRASKILGIFARLDRRDGKPQYLRHMPRVWAYLQRALGAPRAVAAEGVVSCARAEDQHLTAMQNAPRRAMVLAAGLGTRMAPLTDRVPKPLVEVAGKPLIDHVLDRLADAGVERAVVNVHYKAELIEQHLASRAKPQIVISDERGVLLGTGGGLVKALPHLGEEPFYLINSDTIWIDGVTPNLARLAASFDPASMDALLLLASTTGSIGYGGRGDFTMLPRRPPAEARRARGGAFRLCRRGDPFARAVQGPAAGRLRPHRAVQPRRREGPAARPAAGRPLDACRHAGGDRGSGSGDQGERGVARFVYAPPHAGFSPQRLQHPRLGAVPAGADRRAVRRQTGEGLSGLERSAGARPRHALSADAARRTPGARGVPRPAGRRGAAAAHRRARRSRRRRDRVRRSRHRRIGGSRAVAAAGDRAAGAPAAAQRTDPEMGEFAGGAHRAKARR